LQKTAYVTFYSEFTFQLKFIIIRSSNQSKHISIVPCAANELRFYLHIIISYFSTYNHCITWHVSSYLGKHVLACHDSLIFCRSSAWIAWQHFTRFDS